MNQKFLSRERINQSREILLIRRNGKKKFTQAFKVFYLKNSLGYSRMAVAVAKKAGSAVKRNAAKRRVREFFRKNKTEIGSFDCFFYVSSDLKILSTEIWLNSFRQVLKLS